MIRTSLLLAGASFFCVAMCFFTKVRAVHGEIMSIEQQDLVEFVVPNIPMEFRREFSWQPRYSGPVKPPIRTENGSSVYVVFYRVGWFSCLSNFRHRVTYVGGWKTTVPEATYVDEPDHRNSASWDGYQKCQLKYEPGLFTNSFQIGDCTSRKRRMLVALVYRGIRRRRRATAPSPNSYFIAMGRVKSEELHSGERGLEAA